MVPAFKTVDTCAAEFPSQTAYHYKTYDACETEVAPKTRRRAMILGAGPNRIGQGIEFDYCCVHASYALAEAGFETIMVNCNPETVSTDYDTSDKLYFEPLTFEDVMDIVDVEKPDGVVVTLGGPDAAQAGERARRGGRAHHGHQPRGHRPGRGPRPLRRHPGRAGHHVPGRRHGLHVRGGLRRGRPDRVPLLVRPSYVLGGRGMGIVYDGAQLEKYMAEAAKISPDHPVYLDRFLEGAVEVDLDALCDGEAVYVGGVLEHIEMAGIHSGRLGLLHAAVRAVRGHRVAAALHRAPAGAAPGVVGLINIQFAIKDQVIYIIEANPRASRTVPFVSKATGVPLAKCAARIMAGEKIADLGLPADDRRLEHYSVKEAVMPFGRFPGADTVLGPRDEVYGRSHGHCRQLPGGVREDAACHQLRAARRRHGVHQRVRP